MENARSGLRLMFINIQNKEKEITMVKQRTSDRDLVLNPICNYCEYYNFNPGLIGQYVDNGFCKLHEVKKDPTDRCKDFSGC